jgi:Fic/DOC family
LAAGVMGIAQVPAQAKRGVIVPSLRVIAVAASEAVTGQKGDHSLVSLTTPLFSGACLSLRNARAGYAAHRLSKCNYMLKTIDADKAALDAARPFPQYTAASLREKLMLEWTYHSNAIEGNTLMLRETKVVLEGFTVGGKSLREHFDAMNHRDAILYVEDVVSKGEALSEWQICNIRGLVLKGINDKSARYRSENVVIAGTSTTPPDFHHLPTEMAALVVWYETAVAKHPVERAAELHTRFMKIHPFIDGNGRTGRLLLNFEMMKDGYPPVIIRKEDRFAYYDALDIACVSGDYSDITKLVAESLQRSLDTYLDLLGLREGMNRLWGWGPATESNSSSMMPPVATRKCPRQNRWNRLRGFSGSRPRLWPLKI